MNESASRFDEEVLEGVYLRVNYLSKLFERMNSASMLQHLRLIMFHIVIIVSTAYINSFFELNYEQNYTGCYSSMRCSTAGLRCGKNCTLCDIQ